MSWDLIVFSKAAQTHVDADGCAEFAADWTAPEIGTAAELRQKITATFPDTQWSNPTWGLVDAGAFSLEISLGNGDPISSFSIHARGAATEAILRLMADTGWKVLDIQTNAWLHETADPDAGRRQYQALLDSATKPATKPKPRGLLARLFGR